MSETRSFNNANMIADWTDTINEIDNVYGFVNGLNAFNVKGTNQTAIVFDKVENEVTLLPQTSRRERNTTYGKDRKVETFSLALPYFNHQDSIFAEDIQGWRKPGEADTSEALSRAKAEKIEDMKLAADQTKEYMKLEAMKGISRDGEGTVLANMFTEFGVTRRVEFFDLGNGSANITQTIQNNRRFLAKNAKSGTSIGKPVYMVDNAFFDQFVTHPDIEEAYRDYQNAGVQTLRDDLAQPMKDGLIHVFEHRGIVLVNYDATFTLPDGSDVEGIAANEGFTFLPGARDLYRGYDGPSNKLAGANQPGAPMFLYEYEDPRGVSMDFELEMSNLYFMTKPLLSVRLSAAAS